MEANDQKANEKDRWIALSLVDSKLSLLLAVFLVTPLLLSLLLIGLPTPLLPLLTVELFELAETIIVVT